jgi:3-deoxy-D-manno-octulosonic-acid transferase
VIGPNFSKFQEANELVLQKGILSVATKETYNKTIQKLIDDSKYRLATGEINSNYIKNNIGATEKILSHLQKIV